MSVRHSERPRRRQRPRWGRRRRAELKSAPRETPSKWRLRGCLLGLVLVALLVGHYLYWYSVRPRAGAPAAGSFAADLLASEDFDASLWLPFPHQNLGALAERVGDVDRFFGAVAEVAGVPELDVPRFGPFRAPPAHEIVVASADDGERWVAAARVYPGLAMVAKLAGRLASNPWLAGGEVELSGKAAQVSWQGRLWLLQPVGVAPIEARPQPASPVVPEPALARVRITQTLATVPAGSYRWIEEEGGFTLAGAAGWQPARHESPLAPSVVAVAFEAGGGILRRGAQAGVLFESGMDGASPISSLPGTAVLSRPGGKRWKLPGEGLLARLRGELPSAEMSGWSVTAFTRESLENTGVVAERLAPLAEEAQGPRQALWLRPAPTAELVDGVAGALEGIPFVGKHRARRWRAWATVLAPLSRFERLTVAVGRERDELHVRLE